MYAEGCFVGKSEAVQHGVWGPKTLIMRREHQSQSMRDGVSGRVSLRFDYMGI